MLCLTDPVAEVMMMMMMMISAVLRFKCSFSFAVEEEAGPHLITCVSSYFLCCRRTAGCL